MYRIRSMTAMVAALTLALSSCSITSQEASDTTTSLASGSPRSDLVLLDDGLGPFVFGDVSEAVIDGVTASIGGWDADSHETDLGPIPPCQTGSPRLVVWGPLVLTFVERDDGATFSAWSYGFNPLTGDSEDSRQLNLTTPEGIGLGSLRQNLVDAYGSAVSFVDDTVLDTATFAVTGRESTRITGKLNATGTAGEVDFLETTPTC